MNLKYNLDILLQVKTCPQSVPLWILYARLEEKCGTLIKARSVLEKAKLRNPQNEYVWLEAIRVEFRGGLKEGFDGKKEAHSKMARGNK